MSVLDSCCCCSLLSAAIVIGFISSFLYGIGFAIELWWIIEAEGQSNLILLTYGLVSPGQEFALIFVPFLF